MASTPRIDLDVAPRSSPGSPVSQSHRAVAAAIRAGAGGGEDELDLDLSGAGARPLPQKLQGRESNTGLRTGPNGTLISSRVLASKSTSRMGLDEDGLDPFEVRAYADYGDPPAAFYMAPFYAWRVRSRRAELRAELAVKSEAVRAIDERLDDAVVAFAERVRGTASTNPIYIRALAPIEEAERLLRIRDSGLASEVEAYKKTTAGLDERLSQLEAKLHAIEIEESVIQSDIDKLEESQKRESAKLKRVEIEVRSAEEAMARGDAGGAGLKLHAAERLQEQHRATAELARVTPLLAAARKRLEAPRAARAAVDREVADVRKQRGDAEQRLKRQTSAREAGSSDARDKIRAALADFGRNALADAQSFGGDFDASRRAIEALLQDKSTREDGVLMIEKAIACADEEAVKRGWKMAALALGALFLLVFGLPIYRIIVPPKPPPLYPVDE